MKTLAWEIYARVANGAQPESRHQQAEKRAIGPWLCTYTRAQVVSQPNEHCIHYTRCVSALRWPQLAHLLGLPAHASIIAEMIDKSSAALHICSLDL